MLQDIKDVKRCKKCGLSSGQSAFPCDRDGFDEGEHDFSAPITLREQFLVQFPKNIFTKEHENWWLSKFQSQLSSLPKEVEEIIGYTQHTDGCIRSYYAQGRPTENGGYEEMYAGKWYQAKPIDETPKCNCGLDKVISLISKYKDEKPTLPIKT